MTSVTGLTVLILGVPAAVARYAQYRVEREREVEAPKRERIDAWSGFTAAKRNHPPLSELEVR